MPATTALRDRLLARVHAATAAAWAGQEAELAAEEAALGWGEPPSLAELAGLDDDPGAGPPDGADGWLGDLPGPLLDEYLDAVSEPERPEPIQAGFWDRGTGDGAGFASGGVADDLPGGPVLAGLAGDTWDAGLARLGDDELVGVLRAARRLTSWAAALELAAVSDLLRRRETEAAATGDLRTADRVPAEVAAALTLTGRSADALVDLACSLAGLPKTFTALARGEVDRQKVLVIADETAALPPGGRVAVEEQILPAARGQTTGQLRAAVRRAVLAVDAEAARRRQEQAEREARVERWAEAAGTAALAGRDLPPAGVLAADQHISNLARSLKAAGVTGSLDYLRAQVFLALLAGQPVECLMPRAAGPGAAAPEAFSPGASHPAAPSLRGTQPAPAADPAVPEGAAFPASPLSGPMGSAGRGGYPPAGVINLTLPLGTWLGLTDTPGEVAGFGPLGSDDSRALAQWMAAHPATRWCLTATDERGHAVAHGCARASPRPRGASAGSSGPGPPGPLPTSITGSFPAGITGLSLEWLEGPACSHRRECHGYQPSDSLRHLLNIRHRTCSFPGCRRPAVRCDQDHTIPYDQGGRTCECNLAALCRAHHAAKQAPGWHLDQPEPGHLVWTAPSGRTYTTHPTEYLQ